MRGLGDLAFDHVADRDDAGQTLVQQDRQVADAAVRHSGHQRLDGFRRIGEDHLAGHIMGDRALQRLRPVARNRAHNIALGQDAHHAVAFADDQGPHLTALELGAGFIQIGVRRQCEYCASLALENLGDQHGDFLLMGRPSSARRGRAARPTGWLRRRR
uniref:MOSC domain-containing protein n=1 Tax=Parastrongyloides trichosuri TaxID=131310 RepID=A0A0N4Z830_PARTI